MKLKSLYSQLIMNICENNYADADKILDNILTEKVTNKVKKTIKEIESKEKLKKKVVKESISPGHVKISTVRKAETNEWVNKVYVNGKYDEKASYYTTDKEDAVNTKAAQLDFYRGKGFQILGESVLTEALSDKGIATVQKWIAEVGARDAAKKIIDKILVNKLGLSSDDLSDTATFANGLDAVGEALEQGDYQGAYSIAKDTADEMISDEGGEGFE